MVAVDTEKTLQLFTWERLLEENPTEGNAPASVSETPSLEDQLRAQLKVLAENSKPCIITGRSSVKTYSGFGVETAKLTTETNKARKQRNVFSKTDGSSFLNQVELFLLNSLPSYGVKCPRVYLTEEQLSNGILNVTPGRIITGKVRGESLYDFFRRTPFRGMEDKESQRLIEALFYATFDKARIDHLINEEEGLLSQDVKERLSKYYVLDSYISANRDMLAATGEVIPRKENDVEAYNSYVFDFAERVGDKILARIKDEHHANKIAASLGLADPDFIKIYTRLIGAKLSKIEQKFGSWYSDEGPSNRKKLPGSTESVRFDVLPKPGPSLSDDVLQYDTYALALPEEMKLRFVDASCALRNFFRIVSFIDRSGDPEKSEEYLANQEKNIFGYVITGDPALLEGSVNRETLEEYRHAFQLTRINRNLRDESQRKNDGTPEAVSHHRNMVEAGFDYVQHNVERIWDPNEISSYQCRYGATIDEDLQTLRERLLSI
jgi:hypothetical protein